jgi:hypothetical protein
MNASEKLARDGYFRPVYLSLIARANISRHNGVPILERFDTTYSYWATCRDLSANEVVRYLGRGCLANMRNRSGR